MTEREELPEASIKYVEFVEQAAGVPVVLISVGPKRTQTIVASEEYVQPIEEGPYLYSDDFDSPGK